MTRVALAQIDCVLGALEENLARVREQVTLAAERGADVVVFPELTLHGYSLGQACSEKSIVAEDPRLASLRDEGPDLLVGFHEDGGVRRYNSVLYLGGGGVRFLQRKLYLPNYLAWEERKHSSPGQSLRAFQTRIGRAAVLICNDAWQPMIPWLAAQDGAEILYVPANSAVGLGPPSFDVVECWGELLRHIARINQCWVVFCNRVGREEAALFWGGSRVVDPSGETVARAAHHEPELVVAEIDVELARRMRHEVPLLADGRLAFLVNELERLIADGGDR